MEALSQLRQQLSAPPSKWWNERRKYSTVQYYEKGRKGKEIKVWVCGFKLRKTSLPFFVGKCGRKCSGSVIEKSMQITIARSTYVLGIGESISGHLHATSRCTAFLVVVYDWLSSLQKKILSIYRVTQKLLFKQFSKKKSINMRHFKSILYQLRGISRVERESSISSFPTLFLFL